MEYRAIRISPGDNVAIATTVIPKGAEVVVPGKGQVVTNQEILPGHKVALTPITKGADVVRYGEVICSASEDIKQGDWVHVHNTVSNI